jgi:hypothetical protein
MLLVVEKLSIDDQFFLNKLTKLIRENNNKFLQKIIIVHNLMKMKEIQVVKDYIENTLKRSLTFTLKEKQDLKLQGRKGDFNRCRYFEETEDSSDKEITHLIMAQEFTEAGDYYNPFTLELIKQQYNSFNDRKPINIPDEITKLFSELSTEIIGEKMDCQKLGKDNNLIKLVEDNQNNEAKKRTRLQVQNAYIDQDGNYLKNKGKFEPKYSLYYYKEKKKKEEDDDEDEDEYEKYLLLRLELPGNIVRLTARSTDRRKEKYKGIVIKGIKKKDDFKEQSKEDFTIISDNRSYEEFSYFIELKRNLELSGKGAKGNTGIYEIQFDKRNKEKFFQNEKNEKNEKDEKKNANNFKGNHNEKK